MELKPNPETSPISALRSTSRLWVAAVALFGCAAGALAVTPPKEPAKIEITVRPATVAPGGEAEVTLQLRAIEGVKINRYPRVKLTVPAKEGLVGATEVSIGNNAPPSAKAKDGAGYFEKVDPLEMKLKLAEGAPAGRHEIEGKLTFFYCMPASGFCAPKRQAVRIPLSVR